MKFEPKRHQEIAMKFLREHNRGCLFLDMGLGKTVTALTVAKELLDDFFIDKVLVIAPKRVAEDTWSREAAKWDHLKDLRISKVLGNLKQRKAALETDAEIYVINRENTQWLVEYLNGKWPFDLVIIDELSSFKSAKSKRFRTLRRVIRGSGYVWGLTGTPASNGYMDLWAEIFLIDNGERLCKTLTKYRMAYFNPGRRRGNIVYEYYLKPGAKQLIDKKLSDICLSMSKEDWLQLPPIIYNKVTVYMSEDEREVYEEFKKEKVLPIFRNAVVSLGDMESAIVADTAAVLSGKLLQMANGSVYDDKDGVFHLHDRKLDALEDIVDTSNGQPVLVFYCYKHDLDRIRDRFKEAVLLKGPNDIDRWNNGEIQMLLCHPASAGYGINLQQGSHIIVWFGLPYSLEQYQQSNARLHRQGQEKTVIVHHIICDDTLDEKVLDVLQKKDATQRSLLEALKRYFA